MPYEVAATSTAPALIIYLLDKSSSMNAEVNGVRKIHLVSATLTQVVREMVIRSMKGPVPAPRYRIAIYAYNGQVQDVLGGPRAITDVVERGVPVLEPSGLTNTAKAFAAAEQLIIGERAALRDCPAPLVCHLTDGQYNGDDPLPVVERIKQMAFPDGPVLVENVFFDADALHRPVTDPYEWPGVVSEDDLSGDTAKQLFSMSSPIPASYLNLFSDKGYSLRPDARLMFPGDTPEMIEAAFTMSGMTPTV
ncbi:VWA domain-containing protein [Lentzea sp. JNUCC 0626]|uniref:VWA domain-containing protein n=1 Tax=Lentzea sp. JNUCC 0626 TaxID=3367513 RepID=UPI003748B46C